VRRHNWGIHMSDGKDDAEKGRSESTEISSVSFDKFLETVPPGEARRVADVRSLSAVNQLACLRIPQLNLHCEECDGIRTFKCTQSLEVAPGAGVTDVFMEYICSNCGKYQKSFALRFSFPAGDDGFGDCIKFGEIPAYGSPTPNRLLNLFGGDRNQFLKGRRSENERLGFGAFAYYRRVVESHKDQILDEIIKVANEIAPGMVGKLEAAKAENQFLKAIDSVKDALPQALFVNGHNPLTLLHSAMSKGLRANNDKQCLEAARDVRLVLADLVERIGSALKGT
jgi:hypothetical protein